MPALSCTDQCFCKGVGILPGSPIQLTYQAYLCSGLPFTKLTSTERATNPSRPYLCANSLPKRIMAVFDWALDCQLFVQLFCIFPVFHHPPCPRRASLESKPNSLGLMSFIALFEVRILPSDFGQ
jgi:hypothetical protein